MEKEEEGEGAVKLQIKFGGSTIGVRASGKSTVSELKCILQELTNVLPRGQKLIHKGRVLDNDCASLSSFRIGDGSKIMLMASQGLHQGDGPILNQAPVLPNYRKLSKTTTASSTTTTTTTSVLSNSRIHRWKVTGVIGLSESNLKVIPDQVWECGSSARLLDLTNNSISHIPLNITSLTSIQKLILSSNQIADDSINWHALSQLNNLQYLSLNHNLLTYLPPSIGALTSLHHLHVAGNLLQSLPLQISNLTRLQILNVSSNRLSTIPPCIGDCGSLTEVDVSSNLLVMLPETLGSLHNLKSLRLSNNGLKSLPSSIFKKCVKLSSLDLHGTQITMDVLREVEGWEEFDKRRCMKYQKQLDFRAGGSAGFDEGADKN
ncbi:plant intracellular Ras-group-related LRR protein 8 [Silene latifolia]|uniref:plant intracellular Ras-group-related LRR protein 8 n=1 Tax=Silene latifolia TaxID=37657 RepID=UPI003D77674A